MPADWPGPREAEEGTTYRRDGPGDADRFVVEEVVDDDTGATVVRGSWEVSG